MAKYLIQGETLTGIADAIRSKTGGTDALLPTDTPAAIEGISGGNSEELISVSVGILGGLDETNASSIKTYTSQGCLNGIGTILARKGEVIFSSIGYGYVSMPSGASADRIYINKDMADISVAVVRVSDDTNIINWYTAPDY